MENAGAAMAKVIMAHYSPCRALVLCGPGANGGDGFVVARHLRNNGWQVEVQATHKPREGTDAHLMSSRTKWSVNGGDLALAQDVDLVIDCLFGAGLTRPLEGRMAQWIEVVNQSGIPVISADLPSGMPGDLQFDAGSVVRASHTITFEVKKPAHVIGIAAEYCGTLHVVSIGIPDTVLGALPALAVENTPQSWPEIPSIPNARAHKHSRGRLLVVTGSALCTGAARLAARAGLRIGAGWVSLFGPADAMSVCAHHETSLVLHERPEAGLLGDFLDDFRPNAVVLGPAGGVTDVMRQDVKDLLQRYIPTVLDADALTSFAAQPQELFALCHDQVVLTPHFMEFSRLFPDIVGVGNKIEQVREAAERAGCVVLCKGPDTVIAGPGNQCTVNTHASPYLASMGTGDVLAGMIGGLLAQGNPAFPDACAAVWMHGELGRRAGPGLIAEDLPSILPQLLSDMLATKSTNTHTSQT